MKTNPLEPGPPFADGVVARKRAALCHGQRSRRVVSACLLAAGVVGVAVWGLQSREDLDESRLSLAWGLAAATFCIGAIIGRFLLPKPDARCPRCGCDWNVESDNDPDTWTQWQHCPRCGLPMREDHEQPG
ncbi:MAG: hypothetical protein KF833_17365 [Verrucomicrobiae bacterium]|nr:hypothetical protein [Verrucomicrobiae bacterium]